MSCEFNRKTNASECASAYLLLFYHDEILVKKQDGIVQIPTMVDLKLLNMQPTELQKIGNLQEIPYYSTSLPSKMTWTGFSFIKLKQLSEHMAEEYFAMAFRAYHILNWLKSNQYCGCCSGSMQIVQEPQEIAVKCQLCGHIVYPRISPAIIVAVFKDNEILLAHSSRFPPGRYSVIAGFVEPGETIENCVCRELHEEVGITVDNIQYFGNQPWPFPDSLMIAFTARYVSGEITIDNHEIVAAGWFTADALPDIPDKGTISRQLIDCFIANQTISRQ
ncbi:NADH pyrophosphatase [Sporomusaceae bacterium FL31]|nr:NADH pyrophosphatase [Sporomusaceae bacterium FL31]GCE34907.1 NADH pyrophosphatase [Sporomusaceae bacterium]